MDADQRSGGSHRLRSLGITLLAASSVACPIACGKPTDVPEAGALLLTLFVPPRSPSPDELRVSVYDDVGVVFKNGRIPEEGALVPVAIPGGGLGTVLIQPGDSRGQLRIHVRALLDGARILDGVARLPADARAHGAFDLNLEIGIPVDLDMDDVPDLIDDCPAAADPDQNGCPDGVPPDTAPDASTTNGGEGGGSGDAGPGGGVGGEIDVGSGGAGGGGGERDAGSGGGGVGGAGTGGAGGAGRGSGGTSVGGSGGAAGGGTSGGRGGGVGGTSGGGRGTGGRGSGGMSVDAGSSDAAGVDMRPADAQTPKKNLGSTCTAPGDCTSGFCADGVCCQSACDQPCETCGFFGLCLPVKRMNDVPQCTGTSSCNAAGKCVGN